MNAISLACEPRAQRGLQTANVGRTRAISLPMWYLSLLGLSAWSALIAAMIAMYVQPTPRVHDEFSYMLAADTILHGRLANPTPPVWEALQSFHTVMHPAYASKYPVGAGILVALGMMYGMPLASSWLAVGLLTVCVMWMIAGIMPKRWALLGGLLVSLNPFIQLAWSQSLIHGFLPASGSALLLGGVLRLRRRVEFSSALASGVGVALLAISRPYEGLCSSMICSGLLWFAWKRYAFWDRAQLAFRASLYAAAPVIASLVLIAAHNQAVTGNWRQMPYQLHEAQYGVAPLFVFDSPNLENTARRSDLPTVFHDYHAIDSLNWYRSRVGLSGWSQGVIDAFREMMKLTFPMVGLLAISGLYWAHFQLPRNLIMGVALQIAASACVCWVYSHYLAPMLPWLLLITLLAARKSLKNCSKLQSQVMRLAIFAVLFVQVASLVVFAGFAKTTEAELWSRRRQTVVDQLSADADKHLVLVRYSAEHNVHQEWVYNLADPSASKIVWARYEDGRWINALLQEYPGRKVWEIEADESQPELIEFVVGSNDDSSDTSGH